MRLTLRTKLLLATAALGAILGAFWALVSNEQQAAAPAVADLGVLPQVQEEQPLLPSPSTEPVGRPDPFQSLLPEPEPEVPIVTEPETRAPVYFPSIPQPQVPAARPAPKPAPLAWKLVGLGAGQTKLALVKKDNEILVLKEGDAVEGWVLEEIQSQAVLFARGKEKVSIALEEGLVSETE